MDMRSKEHQTSKLAILRNLRRDFNMYQHCRQGGLHYPLEHFTFQSQTAMPPSTSCPFQRQVVGSRPRPGSMVEAGSNCNWCNQIPWSPLHDLPQDAPGVAKMMLCCAADSALTDRNHDGADNRASKSNPAHPSTNPVLTNYRTTKQGSRRRFVVKD